MGKDVRIYVCYRPIGLYIHTLHNSQTAPSLKIHWQKNGLPWVETRKRPWFIIQSQIYQMELPELCALMNTALINEQWKHWGNKTPLFCSRKIKKGCTVSTVLMAAPLSWVWSMWRRWFIGLDTCSNIGQEKERCREFSFSSPGGRVGRSEAFVVVLVVEDNSRKPLIVELILILILFDC